MFSKRKGSVWEMTFLFSNRLCLCSVGEDVDLDEDSFGLDDIFEGSTADPVSEGTSSAHAAASGAEDLQASLADTGSVFRSVIRAAREEVERMVLGEPQSVKVGPLKPFFQSIPSQDRISDFEVCTLNCRVFRLTGESF